MRTHTKYIRTVFLKTHLSQQDPLFIHLGNKHVFNHFLFHTIPRDSCIRYAHTLVTFLFLYIAFLPGVYVVSRAGLLKNKATTNKSGLARETSLMRDIRGP